MVFHLSHFSLLHTDEFFCCFDLFLIFFFLLLSLSAHSFLSLCFSIKVIIKDRFWVTQCPHCQRFSHFATKCPSKKEALVCVYCTGHHKSSDCPDKSNPKCANCSSRATPGVPCSHYALSPDCSIMALQRNIVIEGTDLVSSKNL